jgi:uncharacterized protein YkwD
MGRKKDDLRALKVMIAFVSVLIVFLLAMTYVSSLEKLREREVQQPEAPVTSPGDGVQNRSPQIQRPEDIDFYEMERNLFDMVNDEREAQGLTSLLWNDEVASVAREHSEDLAVENRPLTEFDLSCHRPFIHHEGFDFGLYHDDRLNYRGIYYFSSSGENIFITSAWSSIESYVEEYPEPCPSETSVVQPYNDSDDVLAELEALTEYVQTADRIEWTTVEWQDQDEIERFIVDGWMGSPGHRELILDLDFNEAGVGVAKVNDFYIATQVFIKRVDCGYETGPCCEAEGYYPSCYGTLQCRNSTCYS